MKAKCTKSGNPAQRVSILLLQFLILALALAACDAYTEELSANQAANYTSVVDDAFYNKQDTCPEPDIETEPELAISLSPIPHNTIAIGPSHSLVIVDGNLWAWGRNTHGELGDGTTENRSRPVQVGTYTDWASVAVCMGHTVALKTDGSLWAWGLNQAGQLGDGTTENRSSPVQIGTGTYWAGIFIGNHRTMAIKTDGTLWGWGCNRRGELGVGIVSEYMDGTNVLKPVQIHMYETWLQWTMPREMTLQRECDIIFLIKEDGTLWAWGNNEFGQIGDGTTINRDTPVQIGTDTDWANVAHGVGRTIAVKADGSVWSWGWGGNPGCVGPWVCDAGDCGKISTIGDGTHCEDRHSPVMILEGSRSS